MKDFRELNVWQKAHGLTLAAYQFHCHVSARKTVRIDQQLRRACSSTPANLAEGCGRNGDSEFGRFCSIALGSASELEYHVQRPESDQAQRLRSVVPKRHGTETHADALIQKLKADR